MALFNPLGNAVAQVVPAFVVTCATSVHTLPAHDHHNNNHSSSGGGATGECPSRGDVAGMDTLMLIQAILATATAIWALFFFRREPPSPPSRSAAQRVEKRIADASPQPSPQEGPLPGSAEGPPGADTLALEAAVRPTLRRLPSEIVKDELTSLLRNREFIKLFVGFGIGLGLFNGVLTVTAQMIAPVYWQYNATTNTTTTDQDLQQSDAGMYGGVLIGTGLLGAGIAGPILDKTHVYRSFLKVGFCCGIGALIFMLAMLQPDNQAALTAAFAVMGLFMMPLLPITLETAVECTYPIPEETSASLLMLMGNVVGFICIYSLQVLIKMNPRFIDNPTVLTPNAVFLTSMVIFATAIILTYKGEYKRLAAEAEQRKSFTRHSFSSSGAGPGHNTSSREKLLPALDTIPDSPPQQPQPRSGPSGNGLTPLSAHQQAIWKVHDQPPGGHGEAPLTPPQVYGGGSGGH